MFKVEVDHGSGWYAVYSVRSFGEAYFRSLDVMKEHGPRASVSILEEKFSRVVPDKRTIIWYGAK